MTRDFKNVTHPIPHTGSQIASNSRFQSAATGFPAHVLAGANDILPTSLSRQALNSGDGGPSIDTLDIFPSASTRTINVAG